MFGIKIPMSSKKKNARHTRQLFTPLESYAGENKDGVEKC